MSQDEISALKETLHAQQKLLQKLYSELDAEREASATAASEALSVILRLQGEKSAVKMEAEQYKRLAEEKMCHAEESFAIIEDIIYQKEMEVAALDYQAQAYRYKLLSMGCVDPGGSEMKFPENLLQRNENVACDTSLSRRNSAPMPLKFRRAMIERDSSTSPEIDLISTAGEEINESSATSSYGDIVSYGEQIRKLDLRVKEIAGVNYNSLRNNNNSIIKTRSPSPQLSVGNNSYENCSTSVVLDVFEVPQVDRSIGTSYESSVKDKKRTNEILENREGGVKLYAKDEPDWLKKLLHSTHHEKHLCRPSDVAALERGVAVVNRGSGISEIERVAENTNREEVIKLLKEIKVQISLLQNEIRCEKAKKTSMKEKQSLHPLSEAMLHFWL